MRPLSLVIHRLRFNLLNVYESTDGGNLGILLCLPHDYYPLWLCNEFSTVLSAAFKWIFAIFFAEDPPRGSILLKHKTKALTSNRSLNLDTFLTSSLFFSILTEAALDWLMSTLSLISVPCKWDFAPFTMIDVLSAYLQVFAINFDLSLTIIMLAWWKLRHKSRLWGLDAIRRHCRMVGSSHMRGDVLCHWILFYYYLMLNSFRFNFYFFLIRYPTIITFLFTIKITNIELDKISCRFTLLHIFWVIFFTGLHILRWLAIWDTCCLLYTSNCCLSLYCTVLSLSFLLRLLFSIKFLFISLFFGSSFLLLFFISYYFCSGCLSQFINLIL